MHSPLRYLFIFCLIVCFFVRPVFAGRPLITDDTSTQGKEKIQLQTGFDYAEDKVDDLRAWRATSAIEIDYGIADAVDLIVSSGYQTADINNGGDKSCPSGMVDTLLQLKWRFYDNNKGLSLAVKPGIFIPTGNYTKGIGSSDLRFGSGKIRPRLNLVATQEIGRFFFHMNLGYMRNETQYEAQRDIWHASLAGEWKITNTLKFVCNAGIDTNSEKGTSSDPAFVLGGVVYSVSDKVDIDFGVKEGLNESGLDRVYTIGASIKF